MAIPDVDIDVADRARVLALFPNAIPASQFTSDRTKMVRHNTGVYFQQLPTDPLLDVASFPYEIAEELGYYKVDFISFGIYEAVRDEAHLVGMIEYAESDEFPWEWFQDDQFFDNADPRLRLTHIGSYFDLCKMYPPSSVMDVAILIALIRPRKKYLIGEPWDIIEAVIWKKLPEEDEGVSTGNYFFKKSHAVGYALAVLVHMQLLQAQFPQKINQSSV
jgi:hypothetical protein